MNALDILLVSAAVLAALAFVALRLLRMRRRASDPCVRGCSSCGSRDGCASAGKCG